MSRLLCVFKQCKVRADISQTFQIHRLSTHTFKQYSVDTICVVCTHIQVCCLTLLGLETCNAHCQLSTHSVQTSGRHITIRFQTDLSQHNSFSCRFLLIFLKFGFIQESLVKFEENLSSFQNKWTFDKCERNRGAIIDELFENDRRKSYESSLCDIPTSSLTVTPIINNDNDFYDNVTTSKSTNKNNHLNYRYQKVYQDGTDKTGYFTNTFFINTNKEKEHDNTSSNELKEKLKYYKQNQQRHVNNMGSNVSRNTAKGLSGRRAQSSG